jgi:hypothetical protein
MRFILLLLHLHIGFILITDQSEFSAPTVENSKRVVAVADRTCLIHDDEGIICFPLLRGHNIDVEIKFSDLSMDQPFDSIVVSDTHVCVLTDDHEVRCALLVGINSPSSSHDSLSMFDGEWLHGPKDVQAKQICVGYFFTCALLESVSTPLFLINETPLKCAVPYLLYLCVMLFDGTGKHRCYCNIRGRFDAGDHLAWGLA